MNRVNTLVLIFIFSLFSINLALGEGTKQILLSDAGHGKLSVMPSFSNFAWYTAAGGSAPADFRLHIHVQNIGEKIYYGFGEPQNNNGTQVTDVVYRIKDPLGNIVVGPVAVPLAGAGCISTFNQAVAGPNAIVGAAGYPQLTYTPLQTGDYFIEFNFKTTGGGSHDRTKFKYFDITVASAANQAIDGRIWSKAWQLTADNNGLTYAFNGTLYVYSADSIITSVYGNGVAPYVFTIACNQYGVYNTGNFANDRRSVAGNIILPEFKIFLNNPDSLVYPTGSLGQIILPINLFPNCDGTATLQINVTKPGDVDIFLDINPLPGTQPEDRTLTAKVVAGINNIIWDGLDGLGNPVVNGYVFNVIVTYINGLTNLPIYDIDDHPNGYIINLHRPSGPVPQVFWDDILIGGTQNFTGCTYSLPSTGCHVVPYAQGNNNTVNTWWYAATHTAAPVTFVEYRAPKISAIYGPTGSCPSLMGVMYYCDDDPNATSYVWSYSGSNVTINGNGNDTVYLDFGPAATSGILSVSGVNGLCGPGPATSINVTVNPIPDLTNNPLFQSQCSGMGTNITLTGSIPGTLFTWTCTPSSANITGWSNVAVGTTLLNQTLVNTGFNTETVTYHITPHASGCDGSVYDYVVTVYPVPNVSNVPLSKSQCNNQATGINLTSGVAGTLFTWTCIPSSANISGYAANFVPTTIINQTLVNSAFGIETVTYRITPAANGCNGPVTSYVVTVYPTPNLSNIPLSKSQCNNTATGVTLTSSVAGTTFTWTCLPSSANITGWANVAVGTTSLNQTLVNTGFSTETVTYQITPRANGCNGPVTNYVVTVYPTPNLSNSPANKSQCNNLATGVTLTSNVTGTSFTWTCTPSSANITGWANNAVPTTLLNQTLANSGNVTENVIYRCTPVANGCTGPVTNFTVFVYPTPRVTNAPLTQSQCNNLSTGINLTSNVAGATFTWTCTPSSANITGFSAGAGTSINQTLVNSGLVNETVTYTITPTANGCNGPVSNYVVTVYPSPNVSNSPLSQSQCSGLSTSITLTSGVAGTTFTWTCTPSSASVTGFSAGAGATINQTLTNSGLNIETVTYHITPRANGCNGAVTDYVVTVYPVPNVSNAPLSQSQCNNLPTGIMLTSGVAGTLFTWTCIPSSANISGYASNFVPTTIINQTLVNSAFGTETVTYRITPSANGCTGPITNYVVTVYPTPNLSNIPLSKSQCNNTATGITLTSSVAGTLFTWTCLPSSANITGWANNAVGTTTLNQTLVNTGFSNETVTYQITPRANGCNGPVTNYVVTVYPTPNLSNSPASKNQCNNTATGVTLTSNVAGTSFTWTCTPSSANITGWANNAVPTTLLNQTLANSGNVTENVIYRCTPVANGCTGPVTNYTVFVYPTPTVTNAPLSQGQCNNTLTNITLTSNVAGATFSWTCTPSSANVTGFSAGAGTSINQLLINSGFGNETVTYAITPNANGCNGPVSNYVVTVYGTSNVSNSPLSQSQCSGVNTGITLTSSVAGATFSWTCTPSSASVTGFSAGAGLTINQTLTNTGLNIETVTYHVTPSVGGCSGTPADYVVTVYPVPNVSNAPLSQSQCNNLPTGIMLTSGVAGTLFTWTCTPSSANITGYASNFVPTAIINQTLVNSAFGTETVTYRITPTANGCNGPVTNYVVTVYPTPNLSNIPLSKSQCNNTATGVTLTSSVAGTLFTWTCLPSSANITGWANNAVGTTTLNQTLVNSGFSNETVTYQVTPRANGCNGPVTNYVVTVYPTPNLSNSPLSKSQCNNTATGVTLTSGVAGASFTWTCTPSSAFITGWANNAIPTTMLNQVLVNSSLVSQSVTYHITPTANGCTGPVTDYVVTVVPTPDVSNAPLSKQQCNNTNTSIALTSNVAGTTFTWTCTPSSANITGYSAGAGTSINQTLVNSGFAIETVRYTITPTLGGCNGTAVNYLVTVYPTPNLSNLPLGQSQCSNHNTAITLNSNVAGTLFTWTATGSSASVTGYASNAVPTFMINQTLINTGFNVETVTYHITPRANGCDGPVYDYVVTVLPVPDLSNTPLSQAQCNNTQTNITLTSHVAGTLFTWTATGSSAAVTGYADNAVPTTLLDQLLVNSGFNVEIVTYHITPHAGGCDGVVTDFVVTVYPTPDLSNSPLTKQQCDNSATSILLTSNVSGTTFTWTVTPSSANLTGYGPGSGVIINQTLDNTGFAIETATYHITPQVNGCNGTVYDFVVTVFPEPDLTNSPLSQGQCNNINTGITLTSNVTGTLFTWTCTPSSANITGYAANAIPAGSISQTLVNSGFAVESVTYHITPTANGCAGAVYDYVVNVYPTPDLSNTPLNQSQCNNMATNLTLTSNVSGTTFTWNCTPSSANVTGYSAGSGSVINQTLNNSGYAVESVTYHVTPTANGCIGIVYNYVVTVYPTPDLSNSPLSKAQCSNVNTNVILTSNVAGTLFTWTATGSSAAVTGYANNAVPSALISQTLINSGFGIESVTYHVTPTANGCNGIIYDYVITVYPTPDLSNTPLTRSQCNNMATNLSLTSNVSGTTFTWTCTPSSANVTGYSAGSGLLINDVLVNSGFAVESVTYHITPTANGCNGIVYDYVVTVYPTPDLSNTPLSKSQCNNTNTNITLTSNVAGTLFTWTATASSPSVSGYSNNAIPSVLISQTLVNSGFGIESVTYHVTPMANGCNGIPTDFVVTIYPTPDVSNNPLTKVQCNNLATSLILTSNVSGTTFSWTCTPSSANLSGYGPGSGLIINQTLVNSGFAIESVTYHITPTANGCSGSVYDFVVTVYPTPDLSNSPLSKTQCNNTNTSINLTSNVAGTLFTWTATGSSAAVTGYSDNAIPTTVISQTLVNSGFAVESVTYHVTPAANGCNGIVYDYVVTVYPTPDLSNTPLIQSQCNNMATNLTLTSNVSGTTFTWTCTPSSANVTGYSAGSGLTINNTLVNSGFVTESVIYHITPSANGCNGVIYDYTINVYPTPGLTNSPLNKSQCNNLATNLNLTSNVSGTTFSWTCTPSSANLTGFGPGNGTLINDILVNTGFVNESVTYHITPAANGCNGIVYDYVVTVYPTPDLSNSPLSKAQCNNTNTNIVLTSNVAGTLFTWTATGSGPAVTGYSNSLVPAALLAQTLVNSGYNVESVTYHVTPTANGCNGIVYDYVVTVYPTPDLSNNPLSSSQCNNVTTNIALTSNVAGTLFTWTATGSSANITGYANNAVPSALISQTLVNSGFGIESVTYHITPTANGCNGIVYDYVVTVYPTPDLSVSPLTQAQCNNTNTNITLTSNVAGTLFTWTATGSSAAVSGYTDNAVPSTLISQVLVNSGFGIETVTYHLTPTANGCNGNVFDLVVTVYPAPDLSNSPLSQAQCNNTNTNITLTSNVAGTLFTWTATGSSANITGYANNAVPSTLISQVLVNSGFGIESVTYHVTPTANGCNGIVYDYVVTVYPTPDLSNLPLSQAQCNNVNTNITLTSNVAGTLFTWTATGSSANITGYANNAVPSTLISQVLVNSGFGIESVTYHVTPTANGCNGIVYDYVVTVYPTPDLSVSPLTLAQCNNTNTNITLTSNVAGTLFTWTATGSSANITGYADNAVPTTLISQVLVNSGFGIETVTYHITPTANGCNGNVFDLVVTVYPTPDLSNLPLSQAQCNNTNTNITLTSNVAGTLFTWTATGSSANITGYANNAVPSALISQVLVNSGFGIESVTYHITPTANGCNGIVYDYVVTVYPTPDLSVSPLTQAQCNNTNTNITLTSNVAGTLFTWTATGSTANITGYADNAVPTTLISQVLVNSGFGIESVTYHLTPTANGCNGNVFDLVVTVYPTPDLSNLPLSQAQCNNTNTNITLTSNVAGTLFTWTATGSSAAVTGYSNNAVPSTLISQVLVNSGFATESVTYHVTPTANGCNGIVYDYVVTVYPTPDLSNLPLSQAQCNNTNTNITLTSNVAGTLFTWTATGSSANITGYANNAVPSALISQVLVNSGFGIESVTYHVTPTANGCNGIVYDYVVTVYPTPDLSVSPLTQAQCNNTNTNFTLTSNVAGTLFTWTATGSSANITGYADNAVPTTLISQVLVNSGFGIESVMYHLTPTANGCNGNVFDLVVTVYPTPDLSNSPLSQAQCNNTNTNITLTSNVAGTLFTWTATGSSANITGYANNAVPSTLISQVLVNSGFGIESVTYHITPTANGCNGIVYDYVVTVYPTPDLSVSPLTQAQCNNTNTNITLTSNVAGTLFTWTATGSSAAVSGYSDNAVPSTLISQVLVNSGFGIETVTYHLTPAANGCNGIVYDYVVTVYPTPDLSNLPLSQAQCNNTNTNITLTSNVAGTLFTWTATGSSAAVTGYANNAVPSALISQTLVNSGFGVESVTYHVTPAANGCNGIVYDYVVTVYPTPDLSNLPLSQAQCNNTNTNITLTSNVAGTLFTWTATGSSAAVTGYANNAVPTALISQTLVNSGFNIESVTYHITPTANGCNGIIYDYVVTVYPTPDLSNLPLSQAQCNNLNTNITLTSNVAGTLFTWTATGSSANVSGYANNVVPSALISQTLVNSGYNIESVTYHITPTANGCNGIVYDFVVTVYPTPDLSNSPLAQAQCNNVNTNITLTSNVAGTLFTWTATGSSAAISGYSDNAIPSVLIAQTLVNSGLSVETVTYHITPHANGCDGIVYDYVVTIYQTPDLTNSPLSQAQCNNTNTNTILTSNMPGTLFTWTATGSTAAVTGYSDNAIPTGSISQVLVNSGFGVESVTYHITPTANGCSGIVYDYVVTVYPTPDLSNLPLSQAQCNNLNTNITLTSNVAGTLFTWTATGSSANISGYSNNAIPTTLISQVLVNSGFTVESVTYHITPTANGCNGIVYDYVVTVYPTPDLSVSPLTQAQCNNTNTNIPLTSNVAGTLFTWTATGSSPAVTGYADNAVPTTLISQVLVNSGFGIESVTYHLTPAANGCNGNVFDLVVTVYPTPDLSNSPLSQAQCNNTNTSITLTSNVAGTLFTWTATGSSAAVTGYSNNAVPTALISQTLVNSGFGIESVTYHITPTANGCNGIIYDYVVTVYPTPDLSNIPLAKVQCNNTNTNINLTSNVAGTLFTWTATGSSAAVTGYADNAVPATLISQVLVNSGFAVESVTYHVTPAANGCNGIVYDYVVTVYPTPDLSNLPLSQAQCNNANTSINLTSDVAGTLFTWTATGSGPAVTGYSDNAVPSTLISQVLVNSGFAVESVTYHVTPAANGCNGIVYDYVVTVYPTPDLSNTPLNGQQCNNLATNITLTSHVSGTSFSWTCTPSSLNVTGFSAGAGLLINDVLVNTGFAVESVTYHITPAANGCNGIVYDYVVTVLPTPDLSNSPLAQAQCNNTNTNINLTSNVAGTLFTWTATGSTPAVTGYSDNAVPSALISQVLVNSGFAVEIVTYHVTPTANGCNGITYDYVVTVYPTPDLSNTPLNKQQCNNMATNLTLTSNVSGVTYTWTCTPSSVNVTGYNPGAGLLINDVLVNSGFAIESVTYHITPTANGCNGIVYDYVVTVYPTPDLSNIPLAKVQCNNTNTNINLTSNVAGTLFTWTATGSSPSVTGYADNAVPTALISQVLVNSGFGIESVTYHITPAANGCNGIVYDYVVTVYPTPDVSNTPMLQNQCNNTLTNVTLTSNVAGALFTWTCTASSANITGWSDNPVPTTLINQLLTSTSAVNESVTYHITPIANGCTGAGVDFVVTVVPTAVLTNSPMSQSQCNNLNTNITLTSNVVGTLFTWTATGSSPAVTGYSDNAVPTNLISQTLVNSGFVNETVVYHLIPGLGSCTGTPADFTVTVYPTPDLSNSPLTQAQCSNTNTSLSLTSNVAGTLFTWTATGSSASVSGYSDNTVPASLVSQVLINTSFNDQTVTYHITPHANGCSGLAYDYTVTVHPVPDLSNSPASQAQCDNINTGINLTSHVAGTLFTWTATGSSANVTGYSGNAVPATTISQVLNNSGFAIETVTYHITPTANGCSGPVFDYTVTVYPVPNLSNVPLSSSICNNTGTNVTLTSSVAGSLFTWTATGSSPSITGYSDNAVPSSMISQVLVNTALNVETVTYHITPSANGCNGNITDYVVSVFPVADVIFTPSSQVVCSAGSTAINISSTVGGATFTWTVAPPPSITGATPGSGTMISQVLNLGVYTPDSLNYVVSSTANGCPGAQSQVQVRVNPVSVTTFTICNDPVTTTNATPIVLRGGVPLGGTYSGTGVAGGLFDPAVAGPGNHIITYTYNNTYGCSNSAFQTLTVLAVLPFTCGNILTDVRDGQQYPTIQIGAQCWMASNLNYGSQINSTISQRDNCVVEKYCQGEVSASCATQGGFYQWDEVMHYAQTTGAQGICPPGWHVPDETEWTTLFNQSGPRNNAIAGRDLKATGTSGFNALLNGFSNMNRRWSHAGFATMFWTSTPQGPFKAWAHGMNDPDDGVSSYPGFRSNAFSIRCIR